MDATSDLQDDEVIRRILEESRRIAVIGMKPEGAALAIPRYMARQGYEVIPVNPNYREVDERPTVASVDALEEEVDIVNVFRRSSAVGEHVEQIVAMEPAPRLVWLQLGVRNDRAAEQLAEAGIPVVQDKCIKVEHRRLLG